MNPTPKEPRTRKSKVWSITIVQSQSPNGNGLKLIIDDGREVEMSDLTTRLMAQKVLSVLDARVKKCGAPVTIQTDFNLIFSEDRFREWMRWRNIQLEQMSMNGMFKSRAERMLQTYSRPTAEK